MKVIDARSGKHLPIGGTAIYDSGEYTQLLAVESGIFKARALIRRMYRDHSILNTDLVFIKEDEVWVPLAVRWTHPKYFLEHVGFIPS